MITPPWHTTAIRCAGVVLDQSLRSLRRRGRGTPPSSRRAVPLAVDHRVIQRGSLAAFSSSMGMYSRECSVLLRDPVDDCTSSWMLTRRAAPRSGTHAAADWRRSHRVAPTTDTLADARPDAAPPADSSGSAAPSTSSRRIGSAWRTSNSSIDRLANQYERRTKIVATLGPASDRPGMLDDLLAAGVDVVRLNLSHGDARGAPRAAARGSRGCRTRSAAWWRCSPTCPGRRSAPVTFPEGGVAARAGQSIVTLRPGDGPSDAVCIARRLRRPCSTTCVVATGCVLGDGAISLTLRRPSTSLRCRVRSSRRVATQRAARRAPVRRRRCGSPTPTEEDLILAEAMAAAGVDFLAVSFVRQASDIDEVRAIVGDRAQLVAKIETHAAIDDLARDRGRVRRDHGGPRRPRHRLSARGRARICRSASCVTAWRRACR